MEWEWTVVLYLNVSFNLQQNQELEDGSRASEKLYGGRVHLIKLMPYVFAESLLTVSFTLHVLPYTKSAPSKETILYGVWKRLWFKNIKRNYTAEYEKVCEQIYIFRHFGFMKY